MHTNNIEYFVLYKEYKSRTKSFTCTCSLIKCICKVYNEPNILVCMSLFEAINMDQKINLPSNYVEIHIMPVLEIPFIHLANSSTSLSMVHSVTLC